MQTTTNQCTTRQQVSRCKAERKGWKWVGEVRDRVRGFNSYPTAGSARTTCAGVASRATCYILAQCGELLQWGTTAASEFSRTLPP